MSSIPGPQEAASARGAYLGECCAHHCDRTPNTADECDAPPQVAAAVTKLLERIALHDPWAVEAIRAEEAALIAKIHWLESTVIEKDHLKKWARGNYETILLAELMSISFI